MRETRSACSPDSGGRGSASMLARTIAHGARLTRRGDLDTPEGPVLSAPMPEAPLLRTEALTRAFGSLIAVDRVDVAVRRGELRSIIGPNGAGKTTFFRLISGETTPTSGRVWFGGRAMTRLPAPPVRAPG